MNLYIGDLHFGHRNVIEYDKCPFSNVEEMDREMIDRWNSKVSEEDNVYILGDFAYHNEKSYSWYLCQLKGKKHLIIGNHDRKLLKDNEALAYFESVEPYLEVKDGSKRIILLHYPMAEWNGFFRESWHVYGHIHNKVDGAYRYMVKLEKALNSGACINNYTPCTFEELIRNNLIFKENVRKNKFC